MIKYDSLTLGLWQCITQKHVVTYVPPKNSLSSKDKDAKTLRSVLASNQPLPLGDTIFGFCCCCPKGEWWPTFKCGWKYQNSREPILQPHRWVWKLVRLQPLLNSSYNWQPNMSQGILIHLCNSVYFPHLNDYLATVALWNTCLLNVDNEVGVCYIQRDNIKISTIVNTARKIDHEWEVKGLCTPMEIWNQLTIELGRWKRHKRWGGRDVGRKWEVCKHPTYI